MTSSANTLFTPLPSVCVIRFAGPHSVVASACAPLIPELITRSKTAPITLIASLPRNVQSIHRSMVPFWLKHALHGDLRVKAIGVVSENRTVKMVTSGFVLAMKLANQPVAMQCTTTEEAIVAWALSLETPGGPMSPPTSLPPLQSMH